MKCPYCGYKESKVVDSRPAEEGSSIRRRRECLSCEKRFTTYETVESLPMVVIKKDGSRQSFDRNKILNGMLRACEKRPVSLAALETAALAELGKRSGAILATGGGSVCRAENYPLLHQNGTIFWLRRDLALLPKDGRPISQRSDLAELYAQREPLYARFADAVIDNNGTPEQTVQQILEVLA